jgi:excinuclease ABC subunit B
VDYAKQVASVKTIPQLEKTIGKVKKDMEKAARDLDFMEAARLRDQMFALQRELDGMKR